MDDDTITKWARYGSLGGRPPIDRRETTVALTMRVTLSEYERIVRLAQQRDSSVSATARRLIVLRLSGGDGPA